MLENNCDCWLNREIGGASSICCDDGCDDAGWCVHGSRLVCWSVRRFCAGMMQVVSDPSASRVRVGDERFGV